MVRLKDGLVVYTAPPYEHFNSTMVRLKDSSHFTIVCANALFQFHYGTIKRNGEHSETDGKKHFNSTMVRLKVGDLLPSVAD